MVPLESTEKQMANTGTNIQKQNMKREIKRWPSGNFYLIVEKYVIILLLKFIGKQSMNFLKNDILFAWMSLFFQS